MTNIALGFLNTKKYNHAPNATKESWAWLEETTYALFNASIKREENDIADPAIIVPLKTAITQVYDKIPLRDHSIEFIIDEGLIK